MFLEGPDRSWAAGASGQISPAAATGNRNVLHTGRNPRWITASQF